MQLQKANYLSFKKTTVLNSCRLTCYELQSQTLRSCNDLLQLNLLTQESEISSKISFHNTKKEVTIKPDTTADVLSGERLISFIGPVFSLGFTLTL